MINDIKTFIVRDNPELLISSAEEIGNNLGMSRSPQLNKIYRTIDNEIKKNLYIKNESENISSIVLIKPKIAYVVSMSSPRERPALEKFNHAIIDGIDSILETEGNERIERLRRFKNFIEAIVCYSQYAQNQGAFSQVSSETKRLRDKINSMQVEMNRLLQFVSASSEKVKVFLSHSHIDKMFVEQLKNDLENHGITTWYDNKDLNIGDILTEVISEGIKQSWCFLIVISPKSVKSPWVKFELDEAYDEHVSQGKRILPVLIGNLTDDEIPKRLRKHLYADFREEIKYDQAFEKLYRTVVREGAKELETKII